MAKNTHQGFNPCFLRLSCNVIDSRFNQKEERSFNPCFLRLSCNTEAWNYVKENGGFQSLFSWTLLQPSMARSIQRQDRVSILIFLDSPATWGIIENLENNKTFQSLFSWTLLQLSGLGSTKFEPRAFQSLFSWTLLQPRSPEGKKGIILRLFQSLFS